jgi:DNA-directed RNA polymerase specialized sigma24 family protein
MADFLSDIWWTQNELHRLERELRRFVYLARLNGATWAEIGKELGISRQGAASRFSDVETRLPIDR